MTGGKAAIPTFPANPRFPTLGFVDTQVRNAERAGAAATIVYDYGADGPLLHMGKRPGEKDVSIPAVFISLRAGRLLKTILSDAERKGDLILTILPSEDGDQTWPSLVACAFIACFAMLVVIATLFLLERRNPAFRLNSSGAPGANGGRSGGGSARQRLLTASEVARLPVTCFAENASHSDEDGTHETCAVCLEDYEDQEELRTLDCDHQFHKGCIDPWLITNRDFCPVCKHAVSPPDAPKPAFQRLRWWRWWREGSGHRREAVPESSEEAGPEPGELAARADAVGEGYTGTAAGVASRPDDAAVPRVGNEDSITVPLLPYDAGTDENEAGRRGDDEQGARDYGGGGDDRDGSARRGLWSWFIPRIGRSDNGRVARNDVEEGTAAPMASG